MATGMKGLMLWCKKVTEGYTDVSVSNMTSSFRDGLAFCAIIHHFRPDLIDFGKLSKENIAYNNGLAFRVAEDELDIPALLDVDDMVAMPVPDRLSIMTYVSQYYNYFKDKVPGHIEVRRLPSKKRHTPEHADAGPAKRTLPRADAAAGAQMAQQGSANVCERCGKAVYLMERFTAEGKLFHRVCFTCGTCGSQLKTSTYQYDPQMGKFFCEQHFKERGLEQRNHAVDKNADSHIPSPEAGDSGAVSSSGVSDPAEVPAVSLPALGNGGSNAMSDPGIASTPLEPHVDEHDQELDHPAFVRNQAFVRKGIRPVSTPASFDWERAGAATIKSQPEILRSPVQTKDEAARACLVSFIRKKSKDPVIDFGNPAYQQHLELSAYMQKLNGETSDRSLSNDLSNYDDDDQQTYVNDDVFRERLNGSDHVQQRVLIDPDLDEMDTTEQEFARSDERKSFRENSLEQIGKAKVISKGPGQKKLVLKKKKKDPGGANSENVVRSESSTNLVRGSNELGTTVELGEVGDTSLSGYTLQPGVRSLSDSIRSGFVDESVDAQAPLDIIDKEADAEYRVDDGAISSDGECLEPAFVDARSRLRSSKCSDDVGADATKSGELKVSTGVSQTLLDVRAGLASTSVVEAASADVPAGQGNNPVEESMNTEYLQARARLQYRGRQADLGAKAKEPTPEEIFAKARLKLNVVGRKSLMAPPGSADPVQQHPVGQLHEDKIEDASARSLKERVTVGDVPGSRSPVRPDRARRHQASTPSEKELARDANSSELSEASLNPFLSSDDELIVEEDGDDFDDSNPFAEDARVERRDVSYEAQKHPTPVGKSSVKAELMVDEIGDDFDDSNPFAEDARLERGDSSYQVGESSSLEHRSALKRLESLRKKGIDPSNPFAEDVLEDDGTSSEGERLVQKRGARKLPSIHVPVITATPVSGKNLVLKKRRPKMSRPTSCPAVAPTEQLKAKTGQNSALAKVETTSKKRQAPQIPLAIGKEVAPEAHSESALSSPPSGLKRPAPRPPRPDLPPATESDSAVVSPAKINDASSTSRAGESKSGLGPSVLRSTEHESSTSGHEPIGEGTEAKLAVLPSPLDSPATLQVSPPVLLKPLPPLPGSQDPPHRSPAAHPGDTGSAQKRKAPARPAVQPLSQVSVDDSVVMANVALRDRQPTRAEVETELAALEQQQRHLEREGVIMEKKLRDGAGGEPEEGYLVTWFELVNQKNKLLRRENELIYMVQELDFLNNQRRAEFELRQLMTKPESEKTAGDRAREESLLAAILDFVRRRSDIVDRMDEERLREYEEDREVEAMMEVAGLSKPVDSGSAKPQTDLTRKDSKSKRKDAKKDEKKKKK